VPTLLGRFQLRASHCSRPTVVQPGGRTACAFGHVGFAECLNSSRRPARFSGCWAPKSSTCLLSNHRASDLDYPPHCHRSPTWPVYGLAPNDPWPGFRVVLSSRSRFLAACWTLTETNEAGMSCRTCAWAKDLGGLGRMLARWIR